jgi:6-phosphogluconolactonase
MLLTSNPSRMFAAIAASVALAAWIAPAAAAHVHKVPSGRASDRAVTGFAFTTTNDASGNAVLVYRRAFDGSLSLVQTVPSGGAGTGTPLDSQGALALSDRPDRRFGDGGQRLFAVNAGSSSISEFAVGPEGLTLLDTVPSGGVDPVSVTASDGLLYVLNEGDQTSPGNISGFRFGGRGLSPIPNSTRSLSAASVSAPQISFNRTGGVLVVTEEATNLIDTYTVGPGGRAQGPRSHPSVGQTPFGFAFTNRDDLIVSEAFGGTANAGALSSYELSSNGSLATISPTVHDNQTAPCWVVTTDNGRLAYTSNTGSGTISAYAVDHDGAIALLAADAGSTGTGSAPVDLALSRESRFLYALDSGTHAISGFRVSGDGALVPLGDGPTGLPAGATGLVAG